MADESDDKIVTWNDVYYQTVGLPEEAAEIGSDWGEEGYAKPPQRFYRFLAYGYHLFSLFCTYFDSLHLNLLTRGLYFSVCTFEKGYCDQPIYSCLTCSEIAKRPIGVCFGCYLECHVGHEQTVELFQRRNFKCDCPTLASATCDCLLYKGDQRSLPINVYNKYTPNFEGVFCWCKKEYSADSNKIMIHCFLCEDWFHNTCILADPKFKYPLEESDDVFVCKDCLDRAPILRNYASLQADLPSPSDESSLLIDSTTVPYERNLLIQSDQDHTQKEEEEATKEAPPTTLHGAHVSPTKTAGDCKILNVTDKVESHALFRPDWRKDLCRCKACLQAYEKQDIAFLLEDSRDGNTDEIVDVVGIDEDEGLTLAQAVRNAKKRDRAAMSSMDLLQSGVDAFSALPGQQQAKGNVISAFDKFSKELEEYFKQAAAANQVISADDIHHFFDRLTSKRRKLS